MQIKRILLVVAVLLIAISCLINMNLKFDRLARYPYSLDEKTRKKINYYLSDEEINYIVEWSIQPIEFIDYLDDVNFNIFHIEKYKKFSNKLNYLNYKEIIAFYEEIKIYDENEIYDYLDNYNVEELLFWYKNGDFYNKNSKLIINPYTYDLDLSYENSIGIKKINDLKKIDFIKNNDILLRSKAVDSLNLYCEENIEICNTLFIERGYQSYEALMNAYLIDQDEIPGHSLYQLGLVFDVKFLNEQNKLNFIENIKNYGFIKYKNNSFRYNGLINR